MSELADFGIDKQLVPNAQHPTPNTKKLKTHQLKT